MGKTPAIFLGVFMKELSVFVDESGDFGEYDYHAPFYIISFILHNQEVDISEDVAKLENEMTYLGWSNHCVHVGPAIRGEYEYANIEPINRQKIVKRIATFTRKLNIKVKSFYVEKKHVEDSVEMTGKLSKQISIFIKDNMEYFLDYNSIKIYYDNGQVEVTRILSSVFNALLDNVEFKRVIPSDYRLFQVADLICTLKLIELKRNNNILSKSEKLFFVDDRTLKKNYLKIVESKEMT